SATLVPYGQQKGRADIAPSPLSLRASHSSHGSPTRQRHIGDCAASVERVCSRIRHTDFLRDSETLATAPRLPSPSGQRATSVYRTFRGAGHSASCPSPLGSASPTPPQTEAVTARSSSGMRCFRSYPQIAKNARHYRLCRVTLDP